MTEIDEMFVGMGYESRKHDFTEAKKWLIGNNKIKCFFDGKLAKAPESVEYKIHSIVDPCTGENLTLVGVPSAEDIKNVLQSSTNGLKSWRDLNQHIRGKCISRIGKKLEEQRDILAEIEALSVGVSLSQVKQEVTKMCSYFHYYASWAHIIKKYNKDPKKGIFLVCLSENTTTLALAATVAPVLAAGNVIVLNPSLDASLTSFLFAELCVDAGLPPGIVNILPGSLKETYEMLKIHLDNIVLWGSKTTCQNICSDIANAGVSVIPFHCGKSIGIVFDSSDLTSAIEILFRNMSFSYQQMPWSVKTILVHESVYTSFVAKLKKKLTNVKIGYSHDEGVDIGLPKSCDVHTATFLNNALNEFSQRGAEVFQIPIDDSLFFPPTFIIGSDAELNRIVKDYDVLPFVSILPFRSSNEAVEFANKNQFGTAASVWTSCLSLAMYMATNLEMGTIWINDHGVMDASIPFSGRKHGTGCIGSQKGLQQYLEFENNENMDSKGISHIKPTSSQKEYFGHYGGSYKSIKKNDSFWVLANTGVFQVHTCDQSDINAAVSTAYTAQQKWWKLGSNMRNVILLNIADKFQEISKTFLQFFSNSDADSEREIERTENNLYHWALRCSNMVSFRNDHPLPNYIVQNLREPVGVVGIFMEDASNLDVFVLAVISAISYGNSVVVVLSCKNPIPALEFCAFLASLKVPPGLVNVLPGSKCSLYSEVVFHKQVHALWAFGSHSISALRKMARKNLKFIWMFSSNIADWNESEFEHAASHTKAVWLPSENISC